MPYQRNRGEWRIQRRRKRKENGPMCTVHPTWKHYHPPQLQRRLSIGIHDFPANCILPVYPNWSRRMIQETPLRKFGQTIQQSSRTIWWFLNHVWTLERPRKTESRQKSICLLVVIESLYIISRLNWVGEKYPIAWNISVLLLFQKRWQDSVWKRQKNQSVTPDFIGFREEPSHGIETCIQSTREASARAVATSAKYSSFLGSRKAGTNFDVLLAHASSSFMLH